MSTCCQSACTPQQSPRVSQRSAVLQPGYTCANVSLAAGMLDLSELPSSCVPGSSDSSPTWDPLPDPPTFTSTLTQPGPAAPSVHHTLPPACCSPDSGQLTQLPQHSDRQYSSAPALQTAPGGPVDTFTAPGPSEQEAAGLTISLPEGPAEASPGPAAPTLSTLAAAFAQLQLMPQQLGTRVAEALPVAGEARHHARAAQNLHPSL